MSDRTNQYLRDALGEAEELLLDLADGELEEYKNSRQLQYLTERALEIFGEALRRALDESQEQRVNNSEVREWVALRNIISHQYDDILPGGIWDAAKSDVPILIHEIKGLLSE